MSFLLRVVLPDRPGALGAVATALGTVGADILSVDIVERTPGGGRVTDDFVVELPPDRLADSLITAASTVEGVRVESIRPYAGQIDPHRELELLEALGRGPEAPAEVLADGVARVFRAGWALVLGPPVAGQGEVLARGGAAPEPAPRAGRLVVAAGLGPAGHRTRRHRAGRRRAAGGSSRPALGPVRTHASAGPGRDRCHGRPRREQLKPGIDRDSIPSVDDVIEIEGVEYVIRSRRRKAGRLGASVTPPGPSDPRDSALSAHRSVTGRYPTGIAVS